MCVMSENQEKGAYSVELIRYLIRYRPDISERLDIKRIKYLNNNTIYSLKLYNIKIKVGIIFHY